MNESLSPAILEALRRLDACSVANAIETFEIRLRNEGFTDGSLRCLFPSLPPLVGHAATVKIRGTNPPVGARTYLDRTDWWDYILSIPAPRIVVVQDVGEKPGLGSLLGEVHVQILRALGCAGAATNGSVRDLPAVETLGFPLFAGGLSVSHAYAHLVEIGQPVEIGGLRIASGELLHGDVHGLQTIPAAIAGRIPAAAAAMKAYERRVIEACRPGAFTLERLRSAVSIPAPDGPRSLP